MSGRRTIRDVDIGGKRVFLRVDFNVPIEGGRITDDTRIQASLPSIRYALEHGAAAVICASHLGRPKGKPNPEMSLRPVAARLAELAGRPVEFAEDCVGEPAEAAIRRSMGVTASAEAPVATKGSGPPLPAEAPQGAKAGLVLLENLRFHPEEEKNDDGFARRLAALADVYVNDAFGAAHRAHASTEAIVRHMNVAAAGLLMASELEHLGRALDRPERPFVAVLGGAKVSDKLEVIENFLSRVDALVIGGAMAYTFLLARGVPVGRSRVEPELADTAREIERRARERGLDLELPLDHVVAAAIEADAAHEALDVGDPAIGGRMGLDIGPRTIGRYRDRIASARTVIWNGPMGVFEIDAFARGTVAVARALAGVKGTTIVGGGDSIAALHKAGVADRITHVSTGGGASLEFLAGRTLPGVKAIGWQ